MDPLTIIAAIESAIKVASLAVQVGKDVAPFAQALYDHIFSKTDVTQADLDALEAKLDDLQAQLNAPFPGEDKG